MVFSSWKPWLILALLVLMAAVMGMAQWSYAPLVPFLEKSLNLTVVQIGSLGSMAFLGGALTVLLAGWLVDIFGVKIVSLLACTITLTGLIGMTIATTYGTVVFLFLLLGIGFGAVTPVAMKGAMLWIPPNFRALSLGLLESKTPLGTALAAAILPTIAATSGYQWSFAFSGIMLAVIMVVFAIFYRDPQKGDYNGISSVPAETKHIGQSIGEILKFSPIGFFYAMVEVAWMTFLVSYLYRDLGMEAVSASAFLAVSQVAGAVGRPLLGFGSDKLFNRNRRIVVCIVGFLGGASLLGLALVDTTQLLIIGAMVSILGFTTMGWNGTYYTMIAEIAGTTNAGLGTSVALTISYIGGIIGPVVFGILINNYSYRLAFLLGGILMIGVGFVYSFIKVKQQFEPEYVQVVAGEVAEL